MNSGLSFSASVHSQSTSDSDHYIIVWMEEERAARVLTRYYALVNKTVMRLSTLGIASMTGEHIRLNYI